MVSGYRSYAVGGVEKLLCFRGSVENWCCSFSHHFVVADGSFFQWTAWKSAQYEHFIRAVTSECVCGFAHLVCVRAHGHGMYFCTSDSCPHFARIVTRVIHCVSKTSSLSVTLVSLERPQCNHRHAERDWQTGDQYQTKCSEGLAFHQQYQTLLLLYCRGSCSSELIAVTTCVCHFYACKRNQCTRRCAKNCLFYTYKVGKLTLRRIVSSLLPHYFITIMTMSGSQAFFGPWRSFPPQISGFIWSSVGQYSNDRG